jgi:hypothetical protein
MGSWSGFVGDDESRTCFEDCSAAAFLGLVDIGAVWRTWLGKEGGW